MHRCHICNGIIPHHHEDCRVHQDLRLFERVYARLIKDGRNEILRQGLARHLTRHGRLEMAVGLAEGEQMAKLSA